MRRGFTLVEALVALAILAVALAALLTGQARATRAGARARETAVVRRGVERLSAECLAGVLTAAAPAACAGCLVRPWETVWPSSGADARTWQGWEIVSSNEPAVGLILPVARDPRRL
jgi:prepilin-type N-terminal cleavage/methylation domain-containing protein